MRPVSFFIFKRFSTGELAAFIDSEAPTVHNQIFYFFLASDTVKTFFFVTRDGQYEVTISSVK